jgi:hypothetical protein
MSRSSEIGPFVPTRERVPLTFGALARLPRPVADSCANRSNVFDHRMPVSQAMSPLIVRAAVTVTVRAGQRGSRFGVTATTV